MSKAYMRVIEHESDTPLTRAGYIRVVLDMLPEMANEHASTSDNHDRVAQMASTEMVKAILNGYLSIDSKLPDLDERDKISTATLSLANAITNVFIAINMGHTDDLDERAASYMSMLTGMVKDHIRTLSSMNPREKPTGPAH